ncbi:MAG: CBS domain-containing protein [Thermodesulfobacteriota bacterium]
MLVKNCMTPSPQTVGPQEDVQSAFHLLKKHNFHQVPVVKDGEIVGIATDRDLRVGLLKTGLTVGEIMTPNPVTLFDDVHLEVAARIVLKRKFNAIPVVNHENELVGIITSHDIIERLLGRSEAHEEPTRARVEIPAGVVFEDVLKTFQMSSDKLLSFIKSEEDGSYTFWLRDCDFDKVERNLKEHGLDGVKVTIFS